MSDKLATVQQFWQATAIPLSE